MSPSQIQFRWASGAATSTGRVRKVNQDAYLDRADLGLWAVADGMGGHSDGDRASRLLVERLARVGHQSLLGAGVEAIRKALREVNEQLLRDAVDLGRDLIGSTIVALVAGGDHGAILWVGDSRAYRLRQGKLSQLTSDHTQVQEMVARGLLSPEQAKYHPLSNVLARAVGGDRELAVDCQIEAFRDGDRFLLCSDGLDKELETDQIARLLSAFEPAQSAQALVDSACDAGGRDNVTALVVDIYHYPS